MARDIDRIIDYVRALEDIAPVQRQVIINRIEGDGAPDAEEIDRAVHQVEQIKPPAPWNANLEFCSQVTCNAPTAILIKGVATVRGYRYRVAYCPNHAALMGGQFHGDV